MGSSSRRVASKKEREGIVVRHAGQRDITEERDERVRRQKTEYRKLIPFSTGNQKERATRKGERGTHTHRETVTGKRRGRRRRKKYSTEVNQNHEEGK